MGTVLQFRSKYEILLSKKNFKNELILEKALFWQN